MKNKYGHSCGNCKQDWPCNCDDPVKICGICGGDQYDCRCDEPTYEVQNITAKEIYSKHGLEAYKKMGIEGEWLDGPDWAISAMKEYARQKVKEQRELCAEYDGIDPDTVNYPEPVMD